MISVLRGTHFPNTLKLIRLTLLLLFITSSLSTKAQVLEGIVADNDGGGPLAAVIVVNKAKTQSTMTDVDGKYTIRADKGDEIEFTYMGYYALTLLMPEATNTFRR